MIHDIRNKDDIKLLVDTFYEKVRHDELIGYLFNDVAKVNWEHHLPRMYDFWENVIFQTGNFAGNPMVAHARLHRQSPLSEAHLAGGNNCFLKHSMNSSKEKMPPWQRKERILLPL